MMRIDLLETERSGVSKAIVGILHSSEIRNAFLLPTLALALVLGVYVYERMALAGLDAQLVASQASYSTIVKSERASDVKAQNYERLQDVAAGLGRLRRSAVLRADEIVGIGNVVYRSGLRLTKITDTAADKGSYGHWDLDGEAVDASSTRTCFTNVASSLSLFLADVPGVIAAVPSNQRNVHDQTSVCNYKVTLTRGSE